MKEKHILIIPSWYPTFKGDVGGSFFREQAIALHKAGNKVGVIAPLVRSLRDIKGLITKPYGTKFEDDFGVKTFRNYSVNFAVRMPTLARKWWLKRGKKLFDDYVKKYGLPDIVHVHSMINAGFLAEWIATEHKIPYVVTEHSTAYARNLITDATIHELSSVVNNSSFNIAVSKEFQCLLNVKFRDGCWKYIPNIVNDDFLLHPLQGKRSEKIVFINICFLTQKKRVDLLLKAFANAYIHNKNVLLKLGGDGEEKENLMDLAKELNIEEQVMFLGSLTREEVKKEVSVSDVFVLSSEYETFGVVLIEALALGKPVIATTCGGPESIVVPEVGYLVESNSIEALSEALIRYIENKDTFNPELIRNYCRDNYSEQAIAARLNDVYDDVLKKDNEV